jgi:Alr-MurF fusion protein
LKLNKAILHPISFDVPSIDFEHVSIDSRSLQNGAKTLFFCLKGLNHDAHQYIDSLIEKGVTYFVVQYIPEEVKSKAHFCVVKNTTLALQELAKNYRNQFSFPTLAITGSNGKTIVKEWLNYLLSPDYNIVRSPKSYNSQVGVPLSLFGINENHNLGIFEAGVSLPNEMKALQNMILPDYGIFTHLGDAHNEGFTNLVEKIEEKAQLFNACQWVVLEKNDLVLQKIKAPVFTWSFKENTADVYVKKHFTLNNKTTVEIIWNQTTFTVTIPFVDDIHVENAITCLVFMLKLGVNSKIISERISNLYQIEIRLQAKKGIHNCLLIDDSYSSDYQSLKIALDFLEQQKLHAKKTIILSDIFQSGLAQEELYENVKKMLVLHKISRIITIGNTISSHLKDLPNTQTFSTTTAFLSQFNIQSFQEETILIKGARNFNFDEIVVALEEKKHETVLEINLDALIHNYNFYKSKLKPETKIMVMVKAFGYGNGGYEIAKQLEYLKVSYLGVAFADEGVELRKAGITSPIMVLNPEISSYATMVAYGLEPEVYSIKGLEAFLKLAKEKNLNKYPIHIKLDTGMHRLGFEKLQIKELVYLLKNNNFVEVKSIFSHLAASDDLELKTFTEKQLSLFEEMSQYLINEIHINHPLRHILNTSGIFNFPEYQHEMVRLGIGLYGLANSEKEQKQLEQVSTLKSVISQIRDVPAGDSIGYNRKYMLSKNLKVATIPIGYADGIKRGWGNEKGYVSVNNKKATILGSVCMDMLMVDVTNIDCKEGDTVEIFGKSPTLQEIATICNTISYEIISTISQRVKRIFYKN